MLALFKSKIHSFLRYSQKYTGTDNVYIARGGFWLSVTRGVYIVNAFLLSIAFANFLPPETYGTYKFVLSLAAILAIPALANMDSAVTQAVSRGYEGSFYEALFKKLKWSLFGSLASLALAGYYAVQGDSLLAVAFLIVSVFLPIKYSLGIYSALYHGRREFKISAVMSTVKNLVSIGMLVMTIFASNNIFAILIAYFMPRVIFDAAFLFFTTRRFPPNLKKDPRTLSFGMFLSAFSVLTRIAKYIDKILLWHFLGAVELAIYSFAILPIDHIKGMLENTLLKLALPKLSIRKESELKKSLPPKVLRLFIVLAVTAGIYIVAAPFFFDFLYPKYVDAVPYSRIYALTLLLAPFSLLSWVFGARMKKREIAIMRTVSSSSRIILLGALAPLYGIGGVITAILFSQVIQIIASAILFFKMKQS